MAKEIYSMRKKLVNEKRDMLKQMSPRDLVDKIVDYPNQTILNRDEEGHKRHFPIAVMAKAIKENDYKIKLKYGEYPDRPYDSKAVWGNDYKINEILSSME